ncbi:MAG: hypothetical protein FJW23_06445 [Acidimicrobiia bacterium]|nr:hypothetical protein [Acidimicrobiia bacterium]
MPTSDPSRISPLRPFEVFGSSLYLAIPALGALALRAVRRGGAPDALLAVWGTVAITATLGQNRFGYYAAPVLGILAGWAASTVLEAASRQAPGSRIASNATAVLVTALILYPSLHGGEDGTRLPTAFRHVARTAYRTVRTKLGPNWIPKSDERALFETRDAAYREIRRQQHLSGAAVQPPADTALLYNGNVMVGLQKAHRSPLSVALARH